MDQSSTPPDNDPASAKPDEVEAKPPITRRAFVAAGGMLLAAAVEGCASEGLLSVGPPPPPPTLPPGSIHVTVGGLTGASSGGQVSATRSDNTGSPVVRTLPAPAGGATSTDLIDLSVGNYNVAYQPPNGFQLVGTSPSSQLASVSAGETANVTYSGQAIPGATGSIRVTVGGLTGAAAGGQVTATRADNTGNPVISNLPTPTAGTATTDLTGLSVGSYNVAYQPPTGFQLAASSPSPQPASVAPGGTANVTFTGQALPGTVRVTVTGLTGASSGGQVSLTRTDNSATFSVNLPAPTAGSSTGDLTGVPAGNYNATYVAPTGFQLSPPAQSPQPVTVTAGAMAPVSLVVTVVATGTLRLTVGGLLPGAPNGGVAQVLRTDIAGQTPATVNVPLAGTLDTVVAVGTYSVTFTAPSGHQLAAGEVNPQTNISVLESLTTTVTFQVVQAQAPSGVIFNSDFSTALGTSDNAISDGGKWNLIGGLGQEVVSSVGLNFPTANVLRVNALTQNFGFALNRKTGMPVPAAPFRRFYRWYYRHVKPFGPHPDQHPIQDGNAFSDVNWSLNCNQLSDTTWRPSHEGGGSRRFSINGVLQTNHTYRFELMVDALTATTFRLHIRVYNEAGTQVLGDADYFNIFNINDRLANNPVLTFNRIANLDGLNCGCNGIHNMTQNLVHSYQGGFAVSDTDWIGPYRGGV